MSVLNGPGEGTWSVFALKVVEERDELRHKLAGEAAHIRSLEDLLVDATRERDEARHSCRMFRQYLVEVMRWVGVCPLDPDAIHDMALARDLASDALAGSSAWADERESMRRERDELKARLAHAEADAEQAIHNEAFNERQRIISYIRARLAHATLDDRVSMRERGVMIDLANAIERGEHEQ